MNKFLSFLLLTILSLNAGASNLPTSIKGQEDSSISTITNLQVPNKLATLISAKTYLNETGNSNILANPSFEHSTFSTGWTLTAGSSAVESTKVIQGKKSYKATLSSQTLSLVQDSTTYAGQFNGNVQGSATVRVQTTVSGIFVCPRQAGATTLTNCVAVDTSGTWGLYKIPFILGATSNGIAIVSGTLSSGTVTTGAVTGDVYVDDAGVSATNITDTQPTIGPWITYTTTFTGLGTVSPATNNARWRQVGSNMEIESYITTGTVAASLFSIALPSGYLLDTTRIFAANTTSNPGQMVGYSQRSAAGGLGSLVTATGTSSSLLYSSNGTGTQTPVNGNTNFGSTETVTFRAIIPIAGFYGSTNTYSAPCGASCVDTYTATFSSAGVTSNENVDWINGNTALSTSVYTATFNTGIFTVAPNCIAVTASGALNKDIDVTSTSTTFVARTGTSTLGSASDSAFTIVCQKQGVDFVASSTIAGSFKQFSNVAVLSDTKSSGSNGGTCTAGSFIQRTLNTITDPNGIVTSLSSNRFILPAGRYLIEASAPGYRSVNHKIKLVSDPAGTPADALIGTTETADSSAFTATRSFISGIITPTAATTYEIQHRCGNSAGTGDFGQADSFSVSEVYALIQITRLN